MTRKRSLKSPKQRAEEALAAANRQLDKTRTKQERLATELKAAESAYNLAVRRRNYLAAHPDLTAEDDDELPFGEEP
jgi:hypothetical protein